jgi:hypothetical protein
MKRKPQPLTNIREKPIISVLWDARIRLSRIQTNFSRKRKNRDPLGVLGFSDLEVEKDGRIWHGLDSLKGIARYPSYC